MPEPLATASPISMRLDPDTPTFTSIFGKKGEGKSVLARRLWDSWPYDELVIDVTADALTPLDVDHTYTFVPDVWPARLREDEPVRIRYVPEMRSATYLDDLDRAIGFACRRKGSLVWLDEVGVVSRVGRTGPNMNHLLNQGRHDRMSAVFCGPRPMNIDPLVLHQSDYVYMFRMPNPNDRRRVADSCGIDPRTLDAAILELGDHEYLRWDGTELVHLPPLPLTRARAPRKPSTLTLPA